MYASFTDSPPPPPGRCRTWPRTHRAGARSSTFNVLRFKITYFSILCVDRLRTRTVLLLLLAVAVLRLERCRHGAQVGARLPARVTARAEQSEEDQGDREPAV